jgi:hypothetical protein
MKSMMRSSFAALLVGCVAVLTSGCGAKDADKKAPDAARSRDPYPFMRLTLKNSTPPPGSRKATATVTGTKSGGGTPTTHTVPEVPPNPSGAPVSSTEPAEFGADTVSLTVTFSDGGPSFRGNGGPYQNSDIDRVEIDATETGATARVVFANPGRGQEMITLMPAPGR